jgi:hypothetical protein
MLMLMLMMMMIQGLVNILIKHHPMGISSPIATSSSDLQNASKSPTIKKQDIPSGNSTVLKPWPIEIVDLPIFRWRFSSSQTVNV